MKSFFGGLAAMALGLFANAGGSGLQAPVFTTNYRGSTPSVRTRTKGKPGRPGDKLRKKVEKRSLGLAVIR